jgi:hypothetical protein
MAHLLAARHFDPKVDFVLDIGGQDIKCFKIKNGAIDDIILNEACSSAAAPSLKPLQNPWEEVWRSLQGLGFLPASRLIWVPAVRYL